MINNEDVLKAIVECADENNQSDYYVVANKLGIDDLSLVPFTKSLISKGCIQADLSKIYVTPLTISIYNDLIQK